MDHSLKIYARIGELMQGKLSDGRDFLISGISSTRWYSEVWVEEGNGGEPLPPKACRALELLLEKGGDCEVRQSGVVRQSGEVRPAAGLRGKRVCLRSNIPHGKGLSSSSADVLGVLSLVNGYLGMGLSPAELYGLAAQVEPTDPCLSDEILLFYQQAGIAGRRIGLPPVTLLYFDAGPDRVVDTESVSRPWTPGLGRYYDWLLRGFLRAAEAADHTALFDCITASAEYNQTVVSLPRWEDWLRLATESRCGLMVAHSGTIAGLLVPPERAGGLRARLEAMTGAPVFAEQP